MGGYPLIGFSVKPSTYDFLRFPRSASGMGFLPQRNARGLAAARQPETFAEDEPGFLLLSGFSGTCHIGLHIESILVRRIGMRVVRTLGTS